MKQGKPLLRRLFYAALKAVGAMLLATVLATLLFRFVAPPVSSIMIQRYVAARFVGQSDFSLKYQWESLDRIAPQAALAVVAAEDQKFPDHFGFDFESINKAFREGYRRQALQDFSSGSFRRGGSTITQQVAKNLFLWPGRSFFRKGVEAYFTVLIEGLWPKRRILEIYLNIAEFGPGLFGVKAASALYFKKPPAALTRADAALLAAVLPNPLRLRAGAPTPYVRERQRDIMAQMDQLGGTAYLKGIL